MFGAKQGLGAALARRFAAEGLAIVIAAPQELQSCKKAYWLMSTVEVIVADPTQPDEVEYVLNDSVQSNSSRLMSAKTGLHRPCNLTNRHSRTFGGKIPKPVVSWQELALSVSSRKAAVRFCSQARPRH
ncbi:hypothetical protein [Rhizobium sp. NXC24]|uniref:hypothetical protein n=1 Tax=Rhizobium sp. NXC24 TaxID=2048897 RepID=UPI000CF28313|nr:hypothetical protein [Rhizobium sp. NXC24]